MLHQVKLVALKQIITWSMVTMASVTSIRFICSTCNLYKGGNMDNKSKYFKCLAWNLYALFTLPELKCPSDLLVI